MLKFSVPFKHLLKTKSTYDLHDINTKGAPTIRDIYEAENSNPDVEQQRIGFGFHVIPTAI